MEETSTPAVPPPPPPQESPPPSDAPKPSAAERMANIHQIQKSRRRRGFLIGLLVGQLLIVALDFGGEGLVRLLGERVRFEPPVPLRALVFVGMTAGIVMTALIVLFLLGLQGAGWAFGKARRGFFAAVGVGLKRVWKAAWSLGLTLGVIGGTAWFLIPRQEWKPTGQWLKAQGEKGYKGAKDWLKKR